MVIGSTGKSVEEEKSVYPIYFDWPELFPLQDILITSISIGGLKIPRVRDNFIIYLNSQNSCSVFR